MFEVVCIGVLVADVIVYPVNTMPRRGLLNRVERISLHMGGCAMSAAIDMSKLGLKTALLGMVGNDSLGDFLKDSLVRNNVNIDGLVTDKVSQTSASVVLSDNTGERTFLHYIGVNGIFGMSDIKWEVIENSAIVFIAGTMLMDTFDGEQCASVLRRCKEMGKITVLDTAWDAKGRWMKLLGQCMPYIDIFLPSIEEARGISGKSQPKEIADVFFKKGVKQVVIKLGGKGCYMRESKDAEGVIIPAYSVKAVDTTGAGDSFCAGFITGISRGMSFTECGRFANAVGAHCVSEIGATTGIRSINDILAFMGERK